MPMIITVTPAKRGKFIACLGERRLCNRTFMPFLAAARALAAEGYDPKAEITMRHKGSDVDALTSTIGEASRLSVDEDGPRFIRCREDTLNPGQGSV